MKFPGSVGVITGGSQGFGKAFSIELLKRGGRVAIIDIDQSKGEEFLEQCHKDFGEKSAHFVHCDVTNTESFEDAFSQTISKFGQIDLVCNNAGGLLNWRKMLDLNLVSVMHGTFLAIKHMSVKNGGNGGQIINVASMAGLFPFTMSPAYTASKYGIVGFSQSFKKQLREDQIRVNCLCPSFSPTGLVNRGLEAEVKFQKFVDKIGLVPVDDVAKAFMELVNNDMNDAEVLSVSPAGTAYVKTSLDFTPINTNSAGSKL
eukprot:gene19507-21435_t